MVLGDLPDVVVAHEVDARVADVREPRLVVLHDEGGRGRSHPAQIRIRLRLGEYPRVRARERLAQRLGDVVRLTAEVLRLDGLAGETRGSGSAAMTAHSVGDDEKASAGMAGA